MTLSNDPKFPLTLVGGNPKYPLTPHWRNEDGAVAPPQVVQTSSTAGALQIVIAEDRFGRRIYEQCRSRKIVNSIHERKPLAKLILLKTRTLLAAIHISKQRLTPLTDKSPKATLYHISKQQVRTKQEDDNETGKGHPETS